MSFWVLVQIFINLVLLAAVGFIWVRLNRPAKDDPRLARGLQLLQSKISVLEDLSDRTETQVTQLTSLMEQKCRDIQGYIHQADKQVQKIEASMGKSLEVAKIFQDKIPHQEIIERQNTLKYIKAARLAHLGHSAEDIAKQVDLSQGEIDFIAKVNRDQLQFSEDDLPAWAKEEIEEQELSGEEIFPPLFQKQSERASAFDPQATQQVNQTLSHLGDQFRQAFVQTAVPQTLIEPTVSMPAAPQPMVQKPQVQVIQKFQRPNTNNNFRDSSADVVKKVVFPKIDGSNNWG